MATALFKRAMSGEPSVVDVSLLGTAIWVLSSDVTNTREQTPEQQRGMGSGWVDPMTAAYRTRDGRWIQLMLLQGHKAFVPLTRLLGLDALLTDERFTEAKACAANAQAFASVKREHTDELLAGAGLDDAERARLRAGGFIR